MTVHEALSLAITFVMLVFAIRDKDNKKITVYFS